MVMFLPGSEDGSSLRKDSGPVTKTKEIGTFESFLVGGRIVCMRSIDFGTTAGLYSSSTHISLILLIVNSAFHY